MPDNDPLIMSILHSISRDSLFLSVWPLINFKKKMYQDAFFLNCELIPNYRYINLYLWYGKSDHIN